MQQFKSALCLFVATALFSSTSFAYVLMKGEVAPAEAAPAPYNWSGFYAGLNIGMVKNTMYITDTNATTFLATIQQTLNPEVTGGLQVGYRRQVDFSSLSGVYGLEFSTNFSDARFNKEYGSPFALYQLSSSEQLDNVYLLEVIGGIAANRTFLFLAGGLSWVNLGGDVTSINGASFFNTFSVGKEVAGTAIGGGIEYAFTNAFSVRFKADVITPNTYSTLDNLGDSFQVSNNIVQATFGINYKFG